MPYLEAISANVHKRLYASALKNDIMLNDINTSIVFHIDKSVLRMHFKDMPK